MAVVVDYTSKDFDGFRTSMLDYATTAYPEWQPASVADFGVMMVEAFAYMGDILSYYGDRGAAEAYIGTASQRQSVLNIAEVLGYLPGGRTSSSGTVTLHNDDTVNPVTVTAGTQFLTDYIAVIDGPLIFEVTADTTIPANSASNVPVSEGQTSGTTTFSVLGSSVKVTQIGTVDGTVGQSFVIPDTPIIDSSIRIFVDSLQLGGDAIQEYAQYPHMIDATPSDLGYEYDKDDAGVVYVTLGDGINGVLPPTGNRVWAAYRVGGGIISNVAANAITAFAADPGNLTITGSSAMLGGVDEEPTDQIRTNAPLAYRTQRRAVTLQDFSDLALGISGVGKASAISNSFTSVTVYLLGSSGVEASQGLQDDVAKYLQGYALAGTTVTTGKASLIPINIGKTGSEILLGVQDKFVKSAVQTAVQQALLSYLDPTVRNFADRISLSDIYAVIASVPGVKYATIQMLARNDAAQTGTADIVCNAWEIPVSGTFVFLASGGI